jgi:hypothetical protein
MKKATEETEAGLLYATAHTAHYTAKDLHEALQLYQGVMSAHPDTREAGYARSQIQNIVIATVPKQALFDAQVELALLHVAHGSLPKAASHPVAPVVGDSSETIV